MALSGNDIEKIARLAHLRLTDAERARMESQLSSVLSYIDRLSEAETDGIEPLAHVTGVENIMREDRIEACDKDVREAIVGAFPEEENGQLKVKPVFD